MQQQTAYLVTDDAGIVLTWRYDFDQARRLAEEKAKTLGTVLVTRGGGVLAVACTTGLRGGGDTILRAIDEKFAPYDGYSERRLARQGPPREKRSAVCACGARAWGRAPDGTLQCQVCRAYGYANGYKIFNQLCKICRSPHATHRKPGGAVYEYFCDRFPRCDPPASKKVSIRAAKILRDVNGLTLESDPVPTDGKFECRTCHQVLAWPDSFYAAPGKLNGREASCKRCRCAQKRAKRETAKDRQHLQPRLFEEGAA